MNLSATRTVRELATEIPNATRTFEKLGIDYCCGGSKSLSDACLHAHVSVDDVVLALEQGSNFRPATEVNLPDFANGELGKAGAIAAQLTATNARAARSERL